MDSAMDRRVVIHVDFDAYYAQVEARRLGIPREQPLAVQQWEGLIAVNYAARARGVTRHMRVGEARKLCPELVLAHVETIGAGGEVHDGGTGGEFKDKRLTQKASLERYRRSTAEVMALLHRLLPGVTIEKASIDEVYADVTSMVDRELAAQQGQQRQPQGQGQRQQSQQGLGQQGQQAAWTSPQQQGPWGVHEATAGAGSAPSPAAPQNGREEWERPEDGDAGGEHEQHSPTAAATAATPSPPVAVPPAGSSSERASGADAAAAFAWGAIVMGDGPLDPAREADRRLAAGAGIACHVRGAILDQLSYTSSAGIAHNKLLAKIGSAMHKPNQMTLIPGRAAVAGQSARLPKRQLNILLHLMRDLPLGKVRGFGGKLGEELEALGCTTAGQVQDLALQVLERHFGPERAHYIAETVRGVSHEAVVEKERPKSMLAAKSFNATTDLAALRGWLQILATELAGRMAADCAEHRRRPRNLVLTYRSSAAAAERSKSCAMPRSGPEGPSVEALAEAACALLHGRCLPEALPCTRLAIAAADFVDLPAAGASAITRFLVPKANAAAGAGDVGSGQAAAPPVHPPSIQGAATQAAPHPQQHGKQMQQHAASIASMFERAQKRQRASSDAGKAGAAAGAAPEVAAPESAEQQPPSLAAARQAAAARMQQEAAAAEQQGQDIPSTTAAGFSSEADGPGGAAGGTPARGLQPQAGGAPGSGSESTAAAGRSQPGAAAGEGQDETHALLSVIDVGEQRRILREIEMRSMLDRRQAQQQQQHSKAGGGRGGSSSRQPAGHGRGRGSREQRGIAAFFGKKDGAS
eukprot:scaffold1.g5175.t1